MNDIKEGVRYAFQTTNLMTLAMSGSGHTAMECAVFNIVEPGESVLVSINGVWGERVAEIADRMGTTLNQPTDYCMQGGERVIYTKISYHDIRHDHNARYWGFDNKVATKKYQNRKEI